MLEENCWTKIKCVCKTMPTSHLGLTDGRHKTSKWPFLGKIAQLKVISELVVLWIGFPCMLFFPVSYHCKKKIENAHLCVPFQMQNVP